jgi:hypothetical protein
MTAQDLTPSAITATLAQDVESRLAIVQEQIGSLTATLEELHDSQTVLVNVLATLRAGKSGIPKPRVENAVNAPVDSPAKQDDIETAEDAPTPRAEEPDAGTHPSRHHTAGGQAKQTGADGTARTSKLAKSLKKPAAETLPTRVSAFLAANPGPQKAGEIAQALFSAGATASHTNQVRAAAESLARRGSVEKERQGQSVYFRAVTSEVPVVPTQLTGAGESAVVGSGLHFVEPIR